MREVFRSTTASTEKAHAPISAGAAVKRQTVAGFIIFRRTSEGVKFLLLYRRGGYWNFPKGHFEHGEDSLKTALRETEEETGLKAADLRIVPGFRARVQFHFFHAGHKIQDTVILYLAESRQDKITISPREHSGFAWFFYSDAMRILGRYTGTKRALTEAREFLAPKKIKHHTNVHTKQQGQISPRHHDRFRPRGH